MRKHVRNGFRSITIPVVSAVMLLAGCDGGDSGSSHDFGDNDENVVVCLGDSITEGYGVDAGSSYPNQLAGLTGKTVHNLGVGGSLSSEGVSRVSSALAKYKPGYLCVLYGANDLIRGAATQETIVNNLRTIVQRAKDNKTVAVVATLTPAYDSHSFIQDSVEAIRPKIKTMAGEEDVSCAELFDAFGSDTSLMQSDGLHPNATGLGVVASTFAGNLD